MWKALLALFGRSKMRREVLLDRNSNGSGSIVDIQDWIETTIQAVSEVQPGLLPLPGTWTIEATCDDPADANAKWGTIETGSGSAVRVIPGTFGGFRASIGGMVNYKIRIIVVGR